MCPENVFPETPEILENFQTLISTFVGDSMNQKSWIESYHNHIIIYNNMIINHLNQQFKFIVKKHKSGIINHNFTNHKL